MMTIERLQQMLVDTLQAGATPTSEVRISMTAETFRYTYDIAGISEGKDIVFLLAQ